MTDDEYTVSSIFYATVNFNLNLLTPKYDSFICAPPPKKKVSSDESSTFQDIMMTMSGLHEQNRNRTKRTSELAHCNQIE